MNFEENQSNFGQSSVPADRARRFWGSWWNSEKCEYEKHERYDLRKNFKIESCQLFYNIF